MSGKELSVLVSLGMIWGASFLFMKVGGADLQPFAFVEIRLGLAAIVMLAISAGRPGVLRGVRDNWRPLIVMGLLNCAAPYTLFIWGEYYISSGLAAIYNACAPLWAAALGLVWVWGERLPAGRMAGALLGFAGVSLVVSGNLGGGREGAEQIIGHAACLLAALSYAVAGIFGKRVLRGVPVLSSATGQLVAGSLMVLPLALLQFPRQMPSVAALAAVSTLAIVGTAVASMMYYWLLARIGASKTLLVTYLLPGFALFYGVVLLRETVTAGAVAGLALILLGITVTSGSGAGVALWLRSRWRRATA